MRVINPFEIGKIVKRALKNKNHYQEKVEELKSKPLTVENKGVKAEYDVETNRIKHLHVKGVTDEIAENIRDTINQVFDKADAIWNEVDS